MIHWILTSSLLILAVLLIRAVGRDKLSARVRYALWALVLVRLLIPGSFGNTSLSVLNYVPEAETMQEMGYEPTPIKQQTQTSEKSDLPVVSDNTESSDVSEPSDTSQTTQTVVPTQPSESTVQSETTERSESTANAPSVLVMLWAAGMVLVGGVFAVSNLRFAAKLRRSRQYLRTDTLPVYETAAIETPCLFGFLRPAVYVTPDVLAEEDALRHVLAHELTHYRHKDHIWSLLRCVCVTLHWYNPLVWLAAYISQQDAELACDEGAVKRIGEAERTAYARTLLDLTCVGYKGMLTTATSMTGSESDLKTRVLRIVKNPKMPNYVIPVVLVLAVVLALAVFTDGQADELEGTWYAAQYEKTGSYPDWKYLVNTRMEFRDGRARMMEYHNGLPEYGRDYTYTAKDGILTLAYRDYDGTAGEFRYEWLSENSIALYSDTGLELGLLTRGDPKESALVTDSLMDFIAFEDVTYDTVREAGADYYYKYRFLAYLEESEILGQGGAGATAEYSEYCYRISVLENGKAKELLFADGWLYKDGVRYELSNAQALLSELREMVWHPKGGFTDENGRTYYQHQRGGMELELQMEHDYREIRYYPVADDQWVNAWKKAQEHNVVGDAPHLQNGESSPVLYLYEFIDGGGYVVNVYPDGTMVYFDWPKDADGVGHSEEHYILAEDAPAMMQLLAPYLQVYADSAAKAETQQHIYGLWNLVESGSERVTDINATMNTQRRYYSGDRDVWLAATVDGSIVEMSFDIYLDGSLFHIRWQDGREETVPYTLEGSMLTLYSDDGTWIFQHGETYQQPEETDIIRFQRNGNGPTALRLDMTDEKLTDLEALLREGMVEREDDIIFSENYFYHLLGLEEAFDATSITLSDYGTLHFSGKAYDLTNWEAVEAFLDTIYITK